MSMWVIQADDAYDDKRSGPEPLRALDHGRDPRKRVFVGQAALRSAIFGCMAQSHEERNDPGAGEPAHPPSAVIEANDGAIQRRGLLGGMLKYDHRVAT
jgi:hypothetical protein